MDREEKGSTRGCSGGRRAEDYIGSHCCSTARPPSAIGRRSLRGMHPHAAPTTHTTHQRRLLPPQSPEEAGEQGNNARAREVDAEARRGPQWRAALRERLRSSSSEACAGLAKRPLVVGGRGREQKDHTTVRPHQLSRAHTRCELQRGPAFSLCQRPPPPGIHGRHARVRPRISDCISMSMSTARCGCNGYYRRRCEAAAVTL